MGILRHYGQATVEYIFVLFILATLSTRIVGSFNEFFRDSAGNLAHVLSVNLIVGACPENCFYSGYRNGHSP